VGAVVLHTIWEQPSPLGFLSLPLLMTAAGGLPRAPEAGDFVAQSHSSVKGKSCSWLSNRSSEGHSRISHS